MALLWRKRSNRKTYEVRSAGASVRLYTNGVFHSQFNERRPISGNLWNMLALPGLLHRHPQTLRRVLVLGVGGGAVLRHLAQIAPQARIIGVDLDPIHLDVAQRFFGLTGPNVQLLEAEAVSWLSTYDGEPFDLIIDDLFGETKDSQQLPERAVPVTEQWLELLHQRLASYGVLGFNLEDTARCKEVRRRLKQGNFSSVQAVQITHNNYHNAVLALLPRRLSPVQVQECMAIEPAYRRWQQRGLVPYQFNLYTC